MSCYSPLRAFEIGYNKRTHKPIYKICGSDVVEVVNQGNERAPKWIKVKDGEHVPGRRRKHTFIEIPCGKCIGCRISYAKQWSERCLMELEGHKSSYFVTLTYEDDKLPMTTFVEPDNGVICEINTLRKEDFKKFIKALRQATNQKIRYFACGEYGSQTVRPHFHAILFGLDLDDLIPIGKNQRGDYLYNSPMLDSVWKKGYVVIGSVTKESCNYVARYVTKKVDTPKDIYVARNMEPECIMMSTHPGIGRDFLDRHPEIWNYDYITVKAPTGATDRGVKRMSETVSIPRYFYRVKEKESPKEVKKKKRSQLKFSKTNRILKTQQTDKKYIDALRTNESVFSEKIAVLKKRGD